MHCSSARMWMRCFVELGTEWYHFVTMNQCTYSFILPSETNREKIGQLGGVACIVNAMKSHPTVIHSSSSFTDLVSILVGNKLLISQNGGIECILSAMKRFPTHADLQYNACGIMWNICLSYGSLFYWKYISWLLISCCRGEQT